MTRLSPEEIAEYAYGAGFRGHALTTAVAVAMAESGGKVEAHNDLPPDNSYGPWQINMYGSLGPDRRREYDLDSNRELLDPETNAEVAHRVWRADGSFMAWSAYRFGNYRQFLDEARRAARAVARDGGSGGSGGSGGAGSGSGGFAVDTDLLGRTCGTRGRWRTRSTTSPSAALVRELGGLAGGDLQRRVTGGVAPTHPAQQGEQLGGRARHRVEGHRGDPRYRGEPHRWPATADRAAANRPAAPVPTPAGGRAATVPPVPNSVSASSPPCADSVPATLEIRP